MPHRIQAPTLCAIYREAAARYADHPAFGTRGRDGRYHTRTFRELYDEGLALATALIDLGLQPREHVALIADNRYEWILCDYGILLAGAADVPRGTDTTTLELAHILAHCDARFLILENERTLEKFLQIQPDLRAIQHLILMEPASSPPRGVRRLPELVAHGRILRDKGDRRAETRAEAVQPDDLFTIIYTSGTTGTPKGVQLTHRAMASQVRNLPFTLYPGERALSILPIWHSYERVFEMVAISMGLCTYYTSPRTIADDLKMVRPNVMASAPRLWENLYQKLMARVREMPPPRRALFQLARRSSEAVRNAERFFAGHELDTTGRRLPALAARALHHATAWLLQQIPYRILEPVVLAKLRAAVGCDEFRGTISGGGALQPHVDQFFNSIGIPVLEGYGLTETCPVLAVRTWKNLVLGTVGPPYPETEIRILDLQTGQILYPDRNRRRNGCGLRGEIHVRGPQLMKGYYKDPENTAKVLRDGWLNTGDIGMMTFNGCLEILGRSKETIVLLSGENVEPVPIEHRLSSSPLIDSVMVTGQDQKQLGALIVPSLEGFRQEGLRHTLAELAAHPTAWDRIEAEIKVLINAESGFRPFERIASFRLLPKPFEIGDELTQTLKLKRHVIAEKYRDLLAQMHQA